MSMGICKLDNKEANWINAKDSLPEELQCILGFFKDGSIYVVCLCDLSNICNDWHFIPQFYEPRYAPFDELTYWMPLPEPPKE